MSPEERNTTIDTYANIEYSIGKTLALMQDANKQGQPTRQRWLSLAITDMESAQNWLRRGAFEIANDWPETGETETE